MYKGKSVLAISYGDANYSMSLKLNLFTAKILGKVDKTIPFTPQMLSKEFIEENKEILSMKRGGGYWIWKPHIILEGLKKIEDGEYLVYTDAGMIYIQNVNKLITQMEKDETEIFLSSGFVPNKEWCKRDAFVYMECDTEEYKNRIQVSGGYLVIKKSRKAEQFIKEWLYYVCMKEVITDEPNKCGLLNDKKFHEHRHDQAVLTNLATKWNLPCYKAVTHVDEPRAHIKALHGKSDAYRYTYEERLERIQRKHKERGYIEAKYGRMFINTRIQNCTPIMFLLRLGYAIMYVVYVDIWGMLFDKKYLEKK